MRLFVCPFYTSLFVFVSHFFEYKHVSFIGGFLICLFDRLLVVYVGFFDRFLFVSVSSLFQSVPPRGVSI